MIEDPPLLTILRRFDRPDQALLASLARVPTGHLTDAMDGSGALHSAIKPVDPAQARFVGVALTCETGPSDNLAVMAALAFAQPGDVIVVAASDFTETAVIGDNVATMARNAGVAALVTDGAVRDIAGIVDVGVPVFTRAVTPNSCARSGPGRVGLPVVIGGIAVRAGDVIVGDVDGVVVVPCERLSHVLSCLAGIAEAESRLHTRIAAGAVRMEQIEGLLTSPRVRYLD